MKTKTITLSVEVEVPTRFLNEPNALHCAVLNGVKDNLPEGSGVVVDYADKLPSTDVINAIADATNAFYEAWVKKEFESPAKSFYDLNGWEAGRELTPEEQEEVKAYVDGFRADWLVNKLKSSGIN